MDRKIKERLIGLIVLMTLAVIFLPMMLGGPEEGGGERRLSLESAEESALPETRLDLRESPEEDDDSSGEEVDFEPEESDPSPAGNGSPEPDASDLEPAVPEDEASDAAAAEEDADAESAEEDTAEAPDGDDDGAEDAASSAEAFEGPSGSGWTAQVGSFTRRENAEDLVESLRDSGFEAFLMRHEGSEKVFYRVRVGLESEREEATELARRVHSETGHEATAVPHP